MYTCWDFPLQSNFQQLHFQGLPCLYILWGLPFFLLKLQQFHLQGRPCFVYTLGTSHLQLTTSTLHFQGLPCFGTPLFNQIVVRTITIIIFAFLCRGQLST